MVEPGSGDQTRRMTKPRPNAKQGRPYTFDERASVQLTVLMTKSQLRELDAAKGDEPRATYLRRLLLRNLDKRAGRIIP